MPLRFHHLGMSGVGETTCWVACLDHKPVNDAMEYHIVIIPSPGKVNEIFDSLWRLSLEKLKLKFAKVGVYESDFSPLCRCKERWILLIWKCFHLYLMLIPDGLFIHNISLGSTWKITWATHYSFTGGLVESKTNLDFLYIVANKTGSGGKNMSFKTGLSDANMSVLGSAFLMEFVFEYLEQVPWKRATHE